MRGILALATALMVCAPASAIDDDHPNEISAFYGYAWADGDVSNHSTYGLTYERVFPETGGWGLMFKLERIATDYLGSGLDVNFLDISGTYTFRWNRAKVYVPAGIGVSDSSGPESESSGGLTAHIGLGYKFAFTPSIGLRIDGRYRYGNDVVGLDSAKAVNVFETTFGIGWSW